MIFFLALFLRTYKLSSFPVGFHGDEAEIGYNAFSLLQTGRDKNGQFLPLATDQWGDFRPTGYHYTAILPIAIFGLNEFATRLPAAIFGSLTTIIFFFLVKELWENHRLAVLATFFLAINPWHVIISRATSESVISLFWIILGAYFFLKAVKTRQANNGLLGLAYLFFALSFLFYHAARFFTPLLAFFLTIFYCRRRPEKRKLFIGLNLSLIIAFFVVFIASKGLTRPFDISIFHHQETQLVIEEQIREDQFHPWLVRFFHNKPFGYSLVFLENYFQHFTANFLFFKGGLPSRYSIPWTGNFYLAEAFFMIMGFCLLVSRGWQKKSLNYLLPIFWTIIGPLPAALTFEDIPNLQRSSLMLPGLVMIIAYGLVKLMKLIRPARLKKAILILLTVALAYNFAFFLHHYFHHSLTHQPWHRSVGEKELIASLAELAPQFTRIITTSYDDNNLVFYLFYTQFSPKKFQELGSPRDKNFLNFQNLTYVYDHCPLKGDEKNEAEGELGVLYVNIGPCQLPKNAEKIRSIRRTDDTEAFQLVRLLYLKAKD